MLDDLDHPNAEKYPDQSILLMLLKIKNYVYIEPYVEDEYTIENGIPYQNVIQMLVHRYTSNKIHLDI